jgi:hypothetical protein
MRPELWQPAVELSAQEQVIVRLVRRAKLFVFLRRVRHLLFAEGFQEELAGMYRDSACGQPPIPPARLALATILQAYCGVSDDEMIEAMVMDRRWQLVLGCLDCEKAPFSKGTLVGFRKRLIETGMDRRLVERTVELARQDGGFGERQLRAALDSSPLWGAGRVEDTHNLLGHALCKAMSVIARQQGWGLVDTAEQVGAQAVTGSSLKAALDIDWDDIEQRQRGLTVVLRALTNLERWLGEHPESQGDGRVIAYVDTAKAVRSQDVEWDETGAPKLRAGVAPDRRVSVEDSQMRHGRKSRSQRFCGYKRHVLRDLDSGLVRAVAVTPANVPEAQATDAITVDLASQGATLKELAIDRAYLTSRLVRERSADLEITCKAWPVRNGNRFPKTAFHMDWEGKVLTCPCGVTMPFEPGGVVHFPKASCATCRLRSDCTTSGTGRSVTIHPDEALLCELRQRQLTAAGRQKLRERVAVEHSLAHVGRIQGDRARYVGERKNLFDLRRSAVVHNLHCLSHDPRLLVAA